jgi:hypothetical protein
MLRRMQEAADERFSSSGVASTSATAPECLHELGEEALDANPGWRAFLRSLEANGYFKVRLSTIGAVAILFSFQLITFMSVCCDMRRPCPYKCAYQGTTAEEGFPRTLQGNIRGSAEHTRRLAAARRAYSGSDAAREGAAALAAPAQRIDAILAQPFSAEQLEQVWAGAKISHHAPPGI